MYKYEEPKPKQTPTELKGLSTAIVDAIPLGEAIIDSSIIVPLLDLVGTEVVAEVVAEEGGEAVIGGAVEVEVDVERKSDEMLLVEDDAGALTSTIKSLPSSTSFPILTSTSIPNINSKRKRITPTVVSSLVSQPYIGNMLSSTNNTTTNNNNNSSISNNDSSINNNISSDAGNSSNRNENTIKTKIGDIIIKENNGSNCVSTELSPVSVHTVGVTTVSSPLAVSNSKDLSTDPNPVAVTVAFQPVKPSGIVFPVIPSTITTSISSTSGGMEIKKVGVSFLLSYFQCTALDFFPFLLISPMYTYQHIPKIMSDRSFSLFSPFLLFFSLFFSFFLSAPLLS